MKLNLLFVLSALLLAVACERPFDYELSDVPDDFPELPAPPEGQGYQIHLPPFPIPNNYERELFVRMPIGNTEAIYVNRFHAHARSNTHHIIAYGFYDENAADNPPIGVMRDQNLADGRGNLNLTMGSGSFLYGAQEPENILQYPPGTAVLIRPNSTIDLNAHYFNYSGEQQFGEVYLNMYTVPQDEVTELLIVDDINNEDELYLPAKQTTTIRYEEYFGRTTKIRMMFSHMHKRGKQFKVYRTGGPNDGELVYETRSYQHPPNKFFEPALSFNPGEGLRTEVTYENETNRNIEFGVTSEDEMGILFYSKIRQ
ncbi:MAG: hypothetical protein AAFO94_01940 [Bacteroidota bacterium]